MARGSRASAGGNGDGEDRTAKTCTVCGRTIEWRRKWARHWQDVRYCSDACRRRGRSSAARDLDAALERAILELLEGRAAGATICPSEAARRVATEAGDPGEDAWRELMEPARMAARRLVDRGEVLITQRDRVVDPSTAKGPIRIRRA